MPVVFELGPRDVASGKIVIKRRDTGVKEIIPQEEAAGKLAATLETMQKDLYTKAKQRLKDNTVVANSIEEVEATLKDVTAEKGGGKFVVTHVKDDPANDARIKEFKAKVRGMPRVDEYDGQGKCVLTGEMVDRRSAIAKAYKGAGMMSPRGLVGDIQDRLLSNSKSQDGGFSNASKPGGYHLPVWKGRGGTHLTLAQGCGCVRPRLRRLRSGDVPDGDALPAIQDVRTSANPDIRFLLR